MPELIDQYFLVDRRDAEFIRLFLDKYVPDRGPVTDYYLIVNEDGEEKIDVKNIDDVLSFYEHHVNCDYDIYLENLNRNCSITHAIITYTDDAKAILGVSVIGTFADLTESLAIFNEIKVFVKSTVACMTLEEPPPNNSIEFIEFARDMRLY
ncbi:hypothetical protein [Chitinophaga rhizophila]|uniref:Uncharacterized protein n=1 Tax=Chitinophaga rhizophila TaxID=2866212 RepID=A0ABS7GIA1_9BACT|nr:hypothetical protein [Chitinophaga rhizophila]MBW8686970.1 hypothetical protein [Chitinophaga rhizophila]